MLSYFTVVQFASNEYQHLVPINMSIVCCNTKINLPMMLVSVYIRAIYNVDKSRFDVMVLEKIGQLILFNGSFKFLKAPHFADNDISVKVISNHVRTDQ